MPHLIALTILVAMPLSGYFVEKANERKPLLKTKIYTAIYFVYWSVFFLICLAYRPAALFIRPLTEYPFWANSIFMILTVFIGLSTFLPILTMHKDSVFAVVKEQFDKRRHAFPINGKEQIMFLFVAITVGIVEEFMFRGFLIRYFQDQLGIAVITSFFLVSLIFGIGHFTQGIGGIINTLILGLVLGYFYLVTGSLLIPIVIHIVYDLKVLFLARTLSKKAPLS